MLLLAAGSIGSRGTESKLSTPRLGGLHSFRGNHSSPSLEVELKEAQGEVKMLREQLAASSIGSGGTESKKPAQRVGGLHSPRGKRSTPFSHSSTASSSASPRNQRREQELARVNSELGLMPVVQLEEGLAHMQLKDAQGEVNMLREQLVTCLECSTRVKRLEQEKHEEKLGKEAGSTLAKTAEETSAMPGSKEHAVHLQCVREAKNIELYDLHNELLQVKTKAKKHRKDLKKRIRLLDAEAEELRNQFKALYANTK